MKPARVLPPGTVLPPLVTGDAGKGASNRRPGRKGKRTPARRSRGQPGRFHVLNGFVDGVMATLPRAAVCVWLALYRDTKPNGLARAGVADLAKRAKCDRSTVIRAVRLLVEGGSLDVVRRGGIGRGPSVYRVK